MRSGFQKNLLEQVDSGPEGRENMGQLKVYRVVYKGMYCIWAAEHSRSNSNHSSSKDRMGDPGEAVGKAAQIGDADRGIQAVYCTPAGRVKESMA